MDTFPRRSLINAPLPKRTGSSGNTWCPLSAKFSNNLCAVRLQAPSGFVGRASRATFRLQDRRKSNDSRETSRSTQRLLMNACRRYPRHPFAVQAMSLYIDVNYDALLEVLGVWSSISITFGISWRSCFVLCPGLPLEHEFTSFFFLSRA